jgi:hypothetical protein
MGQYNRNYTLNAARQPTGAYGALAMAVSPTPKQSARAILDIFKSRNCYAGDPLQISYIKTRFLENHGSASDYAAGLMYAEDNGWLEVTPTRDMQPRNTLTLTAVGFAQI